MNSRTLSGAALVAALALPAAAQAHVTLQPKQAPAGAFTVENVRVPNEESDAVTTKVEVQLPSGFASVSYQATAGWTVQVAKAKLATPVQTDDGPVTEEVRRITWTADSTADGIQPGQFRDFPLSVQIPDQAGSKLTFKALQTYSDGTIVRWIGAPDADTPAPQVEVTAANATAPAAASAPAAAAGTSDGSSSDALAIAALAVAAVGAAMAALALARRRR